MTRAAIQRHLRIIGCKLDTHCTQKQLFQRTRLMLLDGDAGRTLLPVYDQRTVTLAAWLWSSKYRLFHRSVITMVLLLAFFERASVRPLSPPAMWSETITASLEIVLLVFLVIDAVLSWKLKRTIKWKSWLAFKVYFVVVAIACICVNAVFPVVPKFHRALRPVVVIASSRSVRRITSSLLRSLVRIIRMAGLLFVHVVVFSVVAFLLFGGQSFDTCSGPPSFQYCSTFTQQCTDYFGSVGMAMRQLFILLTTANFPDVMLPAYKCSPWSAVFFIVYLLLGLSFLLNIVLATSYTAFQANNKTTIIRRVLKRNLALDAVFYAVIDYHRHTRTTVLHPSTQSLDNDLMGLDEFTGIVSQLRPHSNPAVYQVLFKAMQHSQEDGLTSEDFRKLFSYIDVHLRKADATDFLTWTCFGSLPALAALIRKSRSFLTSKRYQSVSDVMLIAYGVLEILRFEEQAKSQNNVFVLPTHAFMWFFTVEVVMKWLCMGSAFVRSKFNVFDAVVVIPTTILDIIKMYSGLPAFMETIIAVLRLLRLLRVVRAFREVRVVLRTYVKIFPVYVRYMIVLAMFFYFFGVVGVECYAGTIGGNIRELDPTDYVSLHYTEINFNSMWEGLVTLFVFMNLSNWPVIVDALTQTTNEFAWLYFALWYLSITICVLNIVTAFILEDFQLMKAFVEDERRLVPAWKQHVLAAMDELGIGGMWQITRQTSAEQVYEALFSDDLPRAEAELFKKYDSKDATVFTSQPRAGFELQEMPLFVESRSAIGEYEALLQQRHVRPQRTRQASCDEAFVDPHVDENGYDSINDGSRDVSGGHHSVSSVDQLRQRSLSRVETQ